MFIVYALNLQWLLQSGKPRKKFEENAFVQKIKKDEKKLALRSQFYYEANIPAGALMLLLESYQH